jgi:hypothetical protein
MYSCSSPADGCGMRPRRHCKKYLLPLYKWWIAAFIDHLLICSDSFATSWTSNQINGIIRIPNVTSIKKHLGKKHYPLGYCLFLPCFNTLQKSFGWSNCNVIQKSILKSAASNRINGCHSLRTKSEHLCRE